MVLFQELDFDPHFVLYSKCLLMAVNAFFFFFLQVFQAKLLFAGGLLLKVFA